MKVLFAGLGGIGQRHLRNLRQIVGDVEVLAYRVRRQSGVLTDKLQIEAGAQLDERYNLRVFSDLDAALAEKPAAVFVCNPTSLHMPVALAAARAGCHLFIEKPLSHDLAEVDELVRVVEAKKLVCLVAYQMRFHPCLRWVASALERKAIGRVLAVRAQVGEYLPNWHTYEDYRQMYAARNDLGGGVIVTQIHEFDYLLWLFGAPQRVFALGGHLSSLEIDVEDVASILMDCSGVPVHLHQDYVQRPPSRTLEVIGNDGKLTLDFPSLTVQRFGADGALADAETFSGFERNQLFLDEMNHFLACLRGEETPVVPLRDGAKSLQIALAAKESLASGQISHLA